MARSFDGINDSLSRATSPLSAVGSGAWTVAFWFRSLDNGRTNDYICSGLGGENGGAIIYEFVDNKIEVYNGGGSGSDPRPSSDITIADTNWHHIAYRSGSGASEWAKYLDGAKTVISASIDFNITSVGAAFKLGASSAGGTAGDFSNCLLLDFACWSSAVSDDNIASMADGFAASFFQPDVYWPLIGRNSPEPSIRGDFPLTVNGATVANGRRILTPTPAIYSSLPPPSVASSTVPQNVIWF